MSTVEANLTINLQDGENPEQIISMIRSVISNITGNDTDVHVIEVDDPLTNSPIGPK
jgi:hypothetical protein